MKEIFQLISIDLEKLIGRNNFNVCHKKCRLKSRATDTLFDAHICYADFMDHVTISHNNRMV
jgi:hypothetical protein